MAEKWFISDTHFYHRNIIRFCKRPFTNTWEMNEALIKGWNARIKPWDKVYHLGDVALRVPNQHKFDELMGRLNGKKRLYIGNHDHIEQKAYRHFERIELWSGNIFRNFNFVCSHLPLKTGQMRNAEFNVHGHLHTVKLQDPRYINICVEHTDYLPVSLDEIRAMIKERS